MYGAAGLPRARPHGEAFTAPGRPRVASGRRTAVRRPGTDRVPRDRFSRRGLRHNVGWALGGGAACDWRPAGDRGGLREGNAPPTKDGRSLRVGGAAPEALQPTGDTAGDGRRPRAQARAADRATSRAALPAVRRAPRTRSSNRFLVQRYELGLVSSAAVWLSSGRATRPRAGPASRPGPRQRDLPGASAEVRPLPSCMERTPTCSPATAPRARR